MVTEALPAFPCSITLLAMCERLCSGMIRPQDQTPETLVACAAICQGFCSIYKENLCSGIDQQGFAGYDSGVENGVEIVNRMACSPTVIVFGNPQPQLLTSPQQEVQLS
jgi:hypothetical protein